MYLHESMIPGRSQSGRDRYGTVNESRDSLLGELIIDNFAGGGGASMGIKLALGRDVDIAINHDREAIAMHEANHPGTLHFCEDVFAVDPVEVTGGRPVGLCWLSPDCKHFSKAKGGKPKSKKIRGLAWVAIKWAATARPRMIVLENVEEFEDWGPLLPDGSPCPFRKGKTFRNFVARLRNLGYHVEWRQLRASSYGAPTIRKRLFLIARRDYRPILWPQPTHGDPKSKAVRNGDLIPWRTAAECIDWSIPCPSIFDRKKPLAEATLRRIARGIRKFVIESDKPFIVPLTHQGGDARSYSVDQPLHTVTGAHRGEMAVVAPTVARVAHSEEYPSGVKRRGDGAHQIDLPLGTIPASNEFAVIAPILTEHANGSKQRTFRADEPLRTQCGEVKGGHFAAVAATLVQTGYGEREGQQPRVPGLDKPLGTVVGGGQKHAAVTAFLAKHYGGHETPGSSLADPAGTITAEAAEGNSGGRWVGEQTDHNAVVAATIVGCGGRMGQSPERTPDTPVNTVTSKADSCLVTATLIGAGGPEYSGKPRPVDAPANSQTAKNHSAVAVTHLSKLYGTTTGQDPDEPMHTVTGQGNHIAEVRAFLIKYYGEGGQDQNLEDPLHTVTSKHRLGLVTIHGQDYVITDIGMRMLTPRELFNAQGFPRDYIIDLIAPDRKGRRRPLPKTSQVRMCGNSVCPPMAEAIIRANYQPLSLEELEPVIPFPARRRGSRHLAVAA